jgi:hypothetical protein
MTAETTETTENADWTIDPATSRSNSSPEFKKLCAEVERLIRGDAHQLINGRASMTAGLIMAHLAHVHHLAPREIPPRGKYDATIREALRIAVTAAENDAQAERFEAALTAMDHED